MKIAQHPDETGGVAILPGPDPDQTIFDLEWMRELQEDVAARDIRADIGIALLRTGHIYLRWQLIEDGVPPLDHQAAFAGLVAAGLTDESVLTPPVPGEPSEGSSSGG